MSTTAAAEVGGVYRLKGTNKYYGPYIYLKGDGTCEVAVSHAYRFADDQFTELRLGTYTVADGVVTVQLELRGERCYPVYASLTVKALLEPVTLTGQVKDDGKGAITLTLQNAADGTDTTSHGAGEYVLVRTLQEQEGWVPGSDPAAQAIIKPGIYRWDAQDRDSNCRQYHLNADGTFSYRHVDGGYMGSSSHTESGVWGTGLPGTPHANLLVIRRFYVLHESHSWDSSDDYDYGGSTTSPPRDKTIPTDEQLARAKPSKHDQEFYAVGPDGDQFIEGTFGYDQYCYFREADKPGKNMCHAVEVLKELDTHRKELDLKIPANILETGGKHLHYGVYFSATRGPLAKVFVYPNNTWTSATTQSTTLTPAEAVPADLMDAAVNWMAIPRFAHDGTLPRDTDATNITLSRGLVMADSKGTVHMTEVAEGWATPTRFLHNQTIFDEKDGKPMQVSLPSPGVLVLSGHKYVFQAAPDSPLPGKPFVTTIPFSLDIGKYVLDPAVVPFYASNEKGVPSVTIRWAAEAKQRQKKKKGKGGAAETACDGAATRKTQKAEFLIARHDKDEDIKAKTTLEHLPHGVTGKHQACTVNISFKTYWGDDKKKLQLLLTEQGFTMLGLPFVKV